MLDDVLPLLRCPHCRLSLADGDGVVTCPSGHSFDIARQGYLSLLPGDAQLGSADTAEQVAARERFLAAGYFDPLAHGLSEEARRVDPPDGCVLDLGAGTGWYLARMLDAFPGRTGLALDLSRHALRRAARAHGRIGAAAADAWGPLPVRDAAVALALSVFAPRNGPELARVIEPGGALITVVPTGRHLGELVEPLEMLSVDERKGERMAAKLDPWLGPPVETPLEWTFELDRTGVCDAVAMGPSATRVDPVALAGLPVPVTVTGSVEISVRRQRSRWDASRHGP
jgi:23S rRNA (guanine745-N1)-methyltransferase